MNNSENNRIRRIISDIFSLSCIIGAAVCVICDISITGDITWSLYPVISCSEGWLILFPIFRCGKKGITASLVMLTVSVIPFICVLSEIIKTQPLIIPIGWRVSLISLAYLWLVRLTVGLLKKRPYIAAVVCIAMLIPLCLAINAVLVDFIGGALADVWDLLFITSAIAVAAGLIARERRVSKQNKTPRG